jgi:hypothetical protein
MQCPYAAFNVFRAPPNVVLKVRASWLTFPD